MPRSLTRWDTAVVVMVVGLTAVFYAFHPHIYWLFQMPVLIAGAKRGTRGGLGAAAAVSLLLLPHVIGLTARHRLSANAIWMDLLSLYVIGITTGWLHDRWRREQEAGERIRDLRSLRRLLVALHRDVLEQLPVMRGHLLAMEPAGVRVPAVGIAVRSLHRSLASMERFGEDVRVLRVDPRFRLARLDRILAAARSHVERAAASGPAVTIEAPGPTPVIPASPLSLSTAIAVLVLQMKPAPAEVVISASRSPGWATLDLVPRGTAAVAPAAPAAPHANGDGHATAKEMAVQVIEAHGGRVENRLGDAVRPSIAIALPSVARIRPVPSRSVRLERSERPARELAVDGSALG